MSTYGFAPGHAERLYEKYVSKFDDPSLRGFITYVRRTLGIDVHDFLTDADLDQLCNLTGTRPEDCEEILMETAWP